MTYLADPDPNVRFWVAVGLGYLLWQPALAESDHVPTRTRALVRRAAQQARIKIQAAAYKHSQLPPTPVAGID